VECGDGEYSNSSSNNVCIKCPSGQEPNSTKSGCTSCEEGEYSNSSSNNVCIKCPSGQESNSDNNKCVQVESCSDLIRIRNGSQCSGYSSPKGNCFFNGDVQIDNTKVRCSDVVDVVRCGDILEMGLCVYAKKDIFPNLVIDSVSFSSTMYCIWEDEKNACVTKNSIKGGLECNKFSIDVCDLFQGCAVLEGIVSLTVFFSFFLFRYLRRSPLS
jgi:hypothetical protein